MLKDADQYKELKAILDELYKIVVPNPEELEFADPSFGYELGIGFEKAKQTLIQYIEKREVETKLEILNVLKKRAHSVALLMPFDNGSVKQYFEELDQAIEKLTKLKEGNHD